MDTRQLRPVDSDQRSAALLLEQRDAQDVLGAVDERPDPRRTDGFADIDAIDGSGWVFSGRQPQGRTAGNRDRI